MTDEPSTGSAVDLLADLPGLTVDTRSCDRGSFLVVECRDADAALLVYELVVMSDPDAELIHSATASVAEPVTPHEPTVQTRMKGQLNA
ncbi:MAG TPA: hypothetical protein VM093_06175 [Aeromicrobium sp.]|nr:hypothetical protein [Aeromicrobium sp.]